MNGTRRGFLWTAIGLAAVALAANGRAAIPGLTYYFRDFTVTFYPLRRLWAAEVAAGRLPVWNPYVHEGAFLLPCLYPLDLVQALWPGPAAASWLLTLHFPIAALAAFLLARDLGCGRHGAFMSGAAYSMAGLAVSSLNLYVFLQSLALAPLVVLGLRRAARNGPRSIAGAAALAALALSTLAVEFVAQAFVLGAALAAAETGPRRAAVRVAASLGLAAGLAAVPLALTADALRHSVRGAGFPLDVVLGNEVHPVVLIQTLLPGFVGSLRAPAEEWWGGRFYSKGFPYFVSLYLGPCVLAVAACGWSAAPRRLRVVLAAAGLAGLWYALGERGGLALIVARLPVMQWFRFPSKALLLPYLAITLLAGFGADRLAAGEGWRVLRRASLAAAGLAAAVGAAARLAPGLPARLYALDAGSAERVGSSVALDALVVAAIAALVAAIAQATIRGKLPVPRAAVLVIAAATADLMRAGAGVNPQVTAAFFEPLPEMRALRLHELDGGRVFSYGLDASPAYRRFLAAGRPGLGLWSFFLSRQALAPYANMIDSVELAEGKDLTSFVPRAPELLPGDYDPSRVGTIVPWLRGAAVTRVVSLDRLSDPALRPLAEIPAGPPSMALHVYALEGSAPRAYVACHAELGAPPDAASRALAEGFRPDHDVVLEVPLALDCTRGAVVRLPALPGDESFDVEADGRAALVLRESYASRWTATVDGAPSPVLRANGKHRAVALPPGRHRVAMRYAPAGLAAAAWASLAAAVLALALAARRAMTRPAA